MHAAPRTVSTTPASATPYGRRANPGSQPVAVVAGRFTAGPNLDLAVLNEGSADVTIFLGDGHGGFTQGQTIAAGNDPTGLTTLALGGDGQIDLLIGNAQGDVLFLDGNGDGSKREG